ncbi:putative DNA modification/repair radical SAM protein [Anaerolentibacter hominis]|uniref:putative DNA modification/repair radical SAM protein n=1 Tax=Anaerolentibacter hominis TaxID=3079009 RepID=UPI0031B810D1
MEQEERAAAHPRGLFRKLGVLTDAAKYDVACTSSGVERQRGNYSMGNTVAGGICHSFAADGRCISLLKILMTNECIFDCRYCVNRVSNDVPRERFTPEEICMLTMEFYRRNYIEGLFLSSGVYQNPTLTMELMYETVFLLRKKYRFGGYIHIKVIPGADPALVEMIGWLADRVSVNLELPTAEGLRTLAPHKNRKNILKPIRQIQLGRENQAMLSGPNTLPVGRPGADLILREDKPSFVPAGQSTQMIIGATGESDYQILSVAQSLYQKFDLKRVFYSAFVRVNDDSLLPVQEQGPPLLREHRIYQGDWLLRFYEFKAEELLSEKVPNFNVFLDPKCNWAVNHLEEFPVEINRADYHTLLRIPGIGVKSAKRIVMARKSAVLDFPDLKKIGVVLKRAVYFITCKGRMMYSIPMKQEFILNNLLAAGERLPAGLEHKDIYEQLSLFDDARFGGAAG